MKSSECAASLSICACLLASPLVLAIPSDANATDQQMAAGSGTQTMSEMADGEVRKVDKDAKKITLRHGELKGLDMPPMTMVFRVQDAAMLQGVKAGDKVRFDARQISGQYVVIKLEPAN